MVSIHYFNYSIFTNSTLVKASVRLLTFLPNSLVLWVMFFVLFEWSTLVLSVRWFHSYTPVLDLIPQLPMVRFPSVTPGVLETRCIRLP